jgi:hypothetical protein
VDNVEKYSPTYLIGKVRREADEIAKKLSKVKWSTVSKPNLDKVSNIHLRKLLAQDYRA